MRSLLLPDHCLVQCILDLVEQSFNTKLEKYSSYMQYKNEGVTGIQFGYYRDFSAINVMYFETIIKAKYYAEI